MAKQLDAAPRNYFQCVRRNDQGAIIRMVCAEGYCSDPAATDPLDKQPKPIPGDNSIPYDATQTWAEVEAALDAKLKANAGIP